MHRAPAHAPQFAFLIAAILTIGCGDSTPAAPPSGRIVVQVATTGASSDIDPDGYVVTIDHQLVQTVDINAVLTLDDLPVGRHLVQLDGLASNCSLRGSNPVIVDVPPGAAAAPVSVYFDVSCSPPSPPDPNPWDY
ncbi:MAG: hypothetical protein M3P12_12025 [Gemmatimonadota bacterium]|nr:hypothetical protein [Gemmatimonadota bacterium]